MSQDVAAMKRRLLVMASVSTVFTVVAMAFAVADFVYGMAWAIWGFVGFLAIGFAVQIWFIRGFISKNRGA